MTATHTPTPEYWEQICYGLTIDALAEQTAVEHPQRKVRILTDSGLNFGHWSDQDAS